MEVTKYSLSCNRSSGEEDPYHSFRKTLLVLVGLLITAVWLTASPSLAATMEGNVSGNLTSWLMLGPLPNGDQGTRLSRDYLGSEVAAAPTDGQVQAGAAWTPINFPAGNSIDLEAYYKGLGASPSNCAFYAFVWINSPQARTVRLEAGSDDGIQVLINGARALYIDTYRGINVGSPDRADVSLLAGWNRVLVKVSQGGGQAGFFLRFVNQDGSAINDLAWSLTAPAGFTPDTLEPAPTLNPPADLADPTPTLSGAVSDVDSGNSPVVKAEFRVDGGDWQQASLGGAIGSPHQPVTFTTPALGSGSHEVELRGQDGWGNVTPEANYAKVTFTIQLDPQWAAQSGLDWAIPAVTQWTSSYNCLGCHVQGVTLYGAARASARGFSVDVGQLRGWADKMRAWQEPSGRILRNLTDNYRNIETRVLNAFTTMGLSAYDQFLGPDYSDVLVKEADWIVSQQEADGHWSLDHSEAPVDQGDIMVTASNMVGLAQARQRADSWRAGIYQAAIDKALTWMRAAAPTTNQDKVYLLLGLLAGGAGAGDAKVAATYQDMLDDQHSDGGWAERNGLQSNAFASGQALYALRQAGLAYNSDQAKTAFEYLVRNQADDGSWNEGVRGTNTDASRPSKFLSTIWPVVALSNAGERRYGVELSASPNGVDVEPGATVQYTVTVHNTAEVAGMGADTFALSVTLSQGWTGQLDISSLTLDPGASGTAMLTVTAPANPAPAEVGLATLQADSGNATANGETVFALFQVPSRVPDRVGPVVTLDEAFTYAGDNTLNFAGGADETTTGNAIIDSVEYQVDSTSDSAWTKADITGGNGTPNVTFQFTATNLAAGDHDIYMRAKDAVGNITAADNYVARSVTILYRGPLVTLQPVLQYSSDNTPRIKGAATDVNLGNAVVQRVEYQVDSIDGQWLPGTINHGTNTTSVKFWFDSVALSEGQHTIYVRAVDSVGNPTEPENMPAVAITVISPGAPQPISSYLRSWLLLGPLEGSEINQEMVPYQAAATPSAGDVQGNLQWEAASFSSNLVDLNDYYNPWVSSGPPDYKTVYAHLYVNSLTEQTAWLRETSDDGMYLWLNGRQVVARGSYRGLDPNNLESVGPVTFHAGWNNLTVKVNEVHSPWGFALRITDEAGADLAGLTYQLNRPEDLPTATPIITFDSLAPTEDFTPTVTGHVTGASGSNIAYVEYQVDSTEGAWRRADSLAINDAEEVDFAFTTPPLEMGTRTINGRAMDQWGNLGAGSTQVDIRYNPFAAAQKGLNWVIPTVTQWTSSKNCLGCHVQGVTMYGAALATSRGYNVDTTQIKGWADKMRAWQEPSGRIVRNFTDYYWNDHNRSLNAFTTMGLSNYDQYVGQDYSDVLVNEGGWIVSQQEADGRWSLDWSEAPVNQGDIMITVSNVVGLAQARKRADSLQAEVFQGAIDKALTWLRAVTPTTNQDKAYLLLGLLAGGANTSDPKVVATRQGLVDDQHDDGGWAERSGLQSNSFATGEAVYALRLAGLGFSEQAISRGLGYLISNQQDDGSWNEGARGVNTDAGRPSKFLSTIWAVIALGDVAQYAVTVLPAAGQDTNQQVQPAGSLTYNLEVGNSSQDPFDGYDLTDTYDLAASVDLPGWTAQLDLDSITLAEEAKIELVLTVSPPATSDGETATITVTATSQGAVGQGGSALGQLRLFATIPPQSGALQVHVVPQRIDDAGNITARAYSDATEWVDGVSDGAGNLTWARLQLGSYKVQVQGQGYLARELDHVQVLGGQTTEQNITLVYGDLDSSGRINLADLNILLTGYGLSQGSATWNQTLDVVPDGRIDIFDIARLVRVFGNMQQ